MSGYHVRKALLLLTGGSGKPYKSVAVLSCVYMQCKWGMHAGGGGGLPHWASGISEGFASRQEVICAKRSWRCQSPGSEEERGEGSDAHTCTQLVHVHYTHVDEILYTFQHLHSYHTCML